MDGGWNCRDHAWASALLSLTLGHTATLVSGEAYFSRGATANSVANSFHVKPHSWVRVHGVGAIDLSVKPVSRIGDNDFRLPIKCIFAGECIPRRKHDAYFLEDPARFARAVETLSGQGNQAVAIYLARDAEDPHAGHVSRAAGWIGSPLTIWLDAAYGNPSGIYAALLMHLRAFLEGRARSLTNVSFEKAWATIAAKRDGAIECARRYIEDRADSRAAFEQDAAVALTA
jgi:hypothetical protein